MSMRTSLCACVPLCARLRVLMCVHVRVCVSVHVCVHMCVCVGGVSMHVGVSRTGRHLGYQTRPRCSVLE